MLSLAEKIIFALIILGTAALFLTPLYQRFQIVRSGHSENRFDRMGKRVLHALSKILLQRCTLKNERLLTGFMHVAIFYGALTFDTMTINHTLEGFFPDFYLFGKTALGDFFSLLVDIFAVLTLGGVLFFIIKRFVIRPKAYATTPLDSAFIYTALILVTLSYLYFEAFAIAHHPESMRLSFLGSSFARAIQAAGMSPAFIAAHFKISWWLHILLVFGFIAYVPHSKYLHMFTGSLNIVFRAPGVSRMVRGLDLETAEVFGIEKALDFNWKDNLDALACMECGRCQDACPAFQSDKPLSPKMILFNMEQHLLKNKKRIKDKKRDDLPALVPAVHTEGEIWTCTTCGACMHVCPVEIEHIQKIVGLRQSQVLMKSKFPAELNAFFRNTETNANPWGIGFAKRADWTEGLEVKLIQDHPDAEYLFWVGCAGSYDEEGKKIARAFVTLLEKAGIDFAILGAEEKCCGDSARRLGNEYLYQTLAAEVIELFSQYKVKKILTICPHGFNTFKNEYPQLLDLVPAIRDQAKAHFKTIAVYHHVEFLHKLIRERRLKIESQAVEALTYHDPCYLGRHNGLLDEPRELLAGLAGQKVIELKNSREHSFCCGAGGGLMWTEESLGKRINHMRAEEVIQSGARAVATACPFCLTMLRDALKDKGKENIKVKDIAVLLVESIESGVRLSPLAKL
jgi:Fe-S oxidoreductase/nitrate reductase gamma subunit